MLRAALALAKKGIHVFPCAVRGKTPAVAGGFKAATTEPELIRRWWAQDPRYNVAVATGRASGIFVVDIDGMDAESELAKLGREHGELPASVETITARGRHVFFQWPGREVRNSASRVAPGVDIRAAGGYVIVPPSIHPSGRRYCWSVDSANTIAAAPTWLLNKIAAPAPGAATPAPPSEWRKLVGDPIPEGRRDSTLASFTGYLLHHDIDAVVTSELVHMVNAARCAPPLPVEDVARIINSIAGKELRRRQGR